MVLQREGRGLTLGTRQIPHQKLTTTVLVETFLDCPVVVVEYDVIIVIVVAG